MPQQWQTRPPRIRGYTGYHPTFSAPGHSGTGGYSSALLLLWRPTRQSSHAMFQTASCSFLIDCKLWWHPASARPRHALCFQPVCALLALLLPLFMFLFMPCLYVCLSRFPSHITAFFLVLWIDVGALSFMAEFKFIRFTYIPKHHNNSRDSSQPVSLLHT